MNPPQRPFVKVCGLTSLGHLRAAESLGACYVGLIVEVARSPRSLTRDQARLMARAARVPSVLVTTHTEATAIAPLVDAIRPAVVQLHGGRSEELLRSVGELAPEVWQVIPVEIGSGTAEVGRLIGEAQAAAAAGASKLVLDSARGGQSGGTGVPANWALAAAVVEAARVPVILAGGLNPENVAEAIRLVRPAGVDVSSGVESSPGIKSARLILSFLRNVSSVTYSAG